MANSEADDDNVSMSYGYPNFLLRENDIEPEMLNEIPEDLRAEILSTIQD